jgi:hypothetical protein
MKNEHHDRCSLDSRGVNMQFRMEIRYGPDKDDPAQPQPSGGHEPTEPEDSDLGNPDGGHPH